MTGMEMEDSQIEATQRSLPKKALSHMANQREEAKDVYFYMFGYDIVTYC